MFYRKILLTMVRSQSYLYSSLIKPKVSFQDDCVRPVGTSPTVLMVKKRPKNQLHWIRISAHGTQHDPKTRELELKTAILKMDAFSRALRQPSHWQLEISSFVLIGCCDDFALVLQHSSKSTLLHSVIGSEN